MPVQVFPSVAVIVLGISAIGAGTWLVDKYIDPRVRFSLCLSLEVVVEQNLARSPFFCARARRSLSCVCVFLMWLSLTRKVSVTYTL